MPPINICLLMCPLTKQLVLPSENNSLAISSTIGVRFLAWGAVKCSFCRVNQEKVSTFESLDIGPDSDCLSNMLCRTHAPGPVFNAILGYKQHATELNERILYVQDTR